MAALHLNYDENRIGGVSELDRIVILLWSSVLLSFLEKQRSKDVLL